MTSPIKFIFESAAIRIIVRDGDPWFVAADLCRALDISQPSRAVARLEDDEKNTLHIAESERFSKGKRAGNPKMTVVSESGLYALVLSSRKPEAKAFKRWVTATVLPSIRKHGGYVAGQEKIATGEMSPEEFLSRAVAMAAEMVSPKPYELAGTAKKGGAS